MMTKMVIITDNCNGNGGGGERAVDDDDDVVSTEHYQQRVTISVNPSCSVCRQTDHSHLLLLSLRRQLHHLCQR